jgi:rhodanese-related sulfurtransferase
VPLFPPPQEQAAPPLPAGLRSISPDQAYAAFQSQSSLFLDARSPEEYARGHIPGALNLPTKDFDSRFPALADRIESAKSIIVYCRSVECSDAVEVAEKLRELIPNSIGVFDRGWETWRAAYPSKQGDQP